MNMEKLAMLTNALAALNHQREQIGLGPSARDERNANHDATMAVIRANHGATMAVIRAIYEALTEPMPQDADAASKDTAPPAG